MLDTSVRLLRLLSLLQSRRDWSGAELAERLEVTSRTVRNDIERLRLLGYAVQSRTGIAGGYRLQPGSAMPPLLLDDEEAVAVGLGTERRGGRNRHRHRGDLAAGDHQARADPTGPAAAATGRAAPGHRVGGGRWADRRRRRPGRAGHRLPGRAAAALRLRRTRRRDRSAPGRAASPGLHRAPLVPARLGPRPIGLADVPSRPGPAAAADRAAVHPAGAARGRGAPRRPRGRVSRLALPGPGPAARPGQSSIADRITPAGGLLTPVDGHTCLLETGGDSLLNLVAYLTSLDVPFEVLDPPELRDLLRTLADRYRAATAG